MQNLKKILKNKKGFTLVELMVVVAILGILVAVAVPVYNNVTENAKKTACKSNISTIESAVVMYQAEEGAIPTTGGDDTPVTVDLTVDELKTLGYLKDVPSCPYCTEADEDDYVIESDGTVKCVCTSERTHNGNTQDG